MNAVDQMTKAAAGHDTAVPAAEDVAASPVSASPTDGAGGLRLLRWLTLAALASIASLAAVLWIDHPSGLWHSGLVRVALAALFLALSGLGGALVMASARNLARQLPQPPVAQPPVAQTAPPQTAPPRLPNRRAWLRRWHPRLQGDPDLIGWAARWPQAVIMTVSGAAQAACFWLLPTPQVLPDAIIVGAAAIALSFPLLLVERVVAATPVSRLPEAPQLRAVLLLAVLAVPAAGLLQIAAGIGVPFGLRLYPFIELPLALAAAELWLRSLGRCFLPPPSPALARAAIDSVLARLIAEGMRTGSLTAPVRQQFGIDFSRSWALAYLRAATPPVLLLLALLCWGLTGVVLIGLDQRGIYERFGAPVAVLRPGLHTILPWPMGQVRRLDFGTIHDMALADSGTAAPVIASHVPASAMAASQEAAGQLPATYAPAAGAEALPPPEADRLWDQAHPAEVTLLVASRTNGQPGFQAVSADIKLRYRVGLGDQDAVNAAYRLTDPDRLLRAAARQVVATFFAARTLDQVLGENREAMAETLRSTIQQKLDAAGCGLELAVLVIEAIHPPAGAADAYHAVQAAQIASLTSVLTERGMALSSRSNASQHAAAIVTQAQAAAAEVTGSAAADRTRFDADHEAAQTNGEAFLLERRLTSISRGLAQSALTVIDHRIPPGEAPTVDLRPMSPLTARSTGHDPTGRDPNGRDKE